MKHKIVIALAVLACACSAMAEVRLAVPFADGMVLQQNMKVPIWGKAAKGEKITINFNGQVLTAEAGADGNWRADLAPMKAGGPYPMTVEGKDKKIEFKTVYVGEVWFCTGQSNMCWPLSETGKEFEEAVKRPANELLRLGKSLHGTINDGKGWCGATPETVGTKGLFPAVPYHFAHELQKTLKVPVGILLYGSGGTRIEWFMSKNKVEAMGLAQEKDGPYKEIRQIQPFAIRGMIWYQGESNCKLCGPEEAAKDYGRLQAVFVGELRKDWGQGDFPFLFVQLPGASSWPSGRITDTNSLAVLREGQRKTLAVPNTAMAVIFDFTFLALHPWPKQRVGERLALAARAIAYGEKIEYSGPVPESAKRKGDEVIITFSHADGLTSRKADPAYGNMSEIKPDKKFEAQKEGESQEFDVKAGNGEFVEVPAVVKGKTVVLDVKGLAAPLTVRYAWTSYPSENHLYNAAGLPASPFEMEVKQ